MIGRTALILMMLGSLARAEGPDAEGTAFFEAKVRPILAERCYNCHSSRAKKVRGGLLLDTKAGWTTGGDSGPAIVPGKPEESLLVKAIRYDDPALQMPPKARLDAAEVATLTDWVRRGAPDPRADGARAAKKPIDIEAARNGWAFRPLKAVAPPRVRDETWCRSPIDRFILSFLEAKGIAPSESAGRRALIRRAYLDVTGLPPTPEEVEAFVDDKSPNAFEIVVDRLLDSPHYGERWARHWLDLARFAESHGFEHDYDRPTAYHYRDFVIEALNRDLPYDTFVQRQLAGDELAPDDNLALKATGFLAAGVHSTQITANQVEKERYDELDDILQTTGTAFLGLTIGCARCHDHKFDPIPQRDYYRLLSTFTTTVRTEVDLVADPKGFARAKEKYEKEHAPYVAALEAFEKDRLPSRLEAWEEGRSTSHEPPRWVALEPIEMKSAGGATFKELDDNALEVGGTNAEFDTYTIVTACDLPEITAVRVEALADPRLVKGGPGRAPNGNFDLTDLKLTIGPRYGIGAKTEAHLINPKASFEQAGLPVAAAIDDDPKSGWAIDPQFGRDHAAAFELGNDVRNDAGATLTFRLDFRGNTGHNIGRLRFSATSSPRPVGLDDDGIPAAIRPTLATNRDRRDDKQTAALLAWYRTIDVEWRALKKALDDHAKTAPKSEGVKALISSEGLPAVRLHTQGSDFLEKTHFLRRGDPNQKMGEASQAFLQVLTTASDAEKHWQVAPPPGWRTSYRRLALARWLTDADEGAGALLARVIVNRLWQHHFGSGIVATPSDFGAQGEKPSHPDLLEWLATDLVQGGWRLKPIHKRILLSAAYQQSSRIDPSKASIDPDDRLLWRYPRRRLEAEAIRDAMLAVSGRLDPRMFGPGTLDERQRRRSIYFTVKRSKLIPMMTLFDAPDALSGVGARPATTVAPQALMLMNSPIVRDWAVGFARRIAPKPGGSLEDSVRSAYRIALARPPSDDELRDALGFLAEQANLHREAGQGDGQAAALADFCQAILGLNEFIEVE
ncbi:MAG TPA: PSD1 and planctomycete cytochrome C domain-containing protein [Isosphaeraceae bacterium]|jgi:hypothetical protein|nr:PSD1 and planctomycete cytochrome C domain-containing protein [Isosphaeraceae bacterium]